MKFDRLRASITNNAQEEPSVYMAVCAMESLLRDMEDESGLTLDRLPAGNEMLSAKLIWLCRTIRGIYSSHSGDLQRSRSKLDHAIADLQQTADSMGELAREEEALIRLKERRSALEQQVGQLRQTREAAVSIQEQIDALEPQLEKLRAADPEKKREELSRLRSQIDLLRGEQQELDKELEAEQNSLSEVQQACEDAERQSSECRSKKEAFSRKALALSTELEQLGSLLRQQEDQLRELDEKKQELQRQRVSMEAQLREKGEELAVYQTKELDPLLRDLEELRIDNAKHEEEKAQVLEKLQQQKQRRDRLVLDIASLKQDCEAVEAAAQDKDEERIRAEARCRLARDKEQELQQKLDSLREELSSLQDQVFHLEQEELPRQQQFTADEQDRRDKLQAQWNETKAKSDQLQADTERLTQELRELEEDCRISQHSYDTLSADSAGKREELQVLGARIKELEGKTEVQRYEVLKRQQEDRIQQLEQIRENCRKLEEEIPDTEAQLASEQQKFRELTARRDQMAKTRQEITARREQLQKYASREFESSLAGSLRRLALLNEGRDQLRSTLDLVREVTGAETLDDKGQDLLLQTGQGVKQLQDAVLSLQKALVNCADLAQLKSEE